MRAAGKRVPLISVQGHHLRFVTRSEGRSLVEDFGKAEEHVGYFQMVEHHVGDRRSDGCISAHEMETNAGMHGTVGDHYEETREKVLIFGATSIRHYDNANEENHSQDSNEPCQATA